MFTLQHRQDVETKLAGLLSPSSLSSAHSHFSSTVSYGRMFLY